MASARARLRDIYAALDEAPSYAAWRAAAEAHDALTGAAAWRDDDESPHYESAALWRAIRQWRQQRHAGDALSLALTLTEDLYRHGHEIAAPDLYDTAMAGPKRLVERFLDEAEASLRWLAAVDVPGVPPAEKRVRFETAWRVFGRSALMLSGGATLGFHHLGVVKALHEEGLLPHILSGASTGAMIAAGICARNDAELSEMFADLDQLRLDGLAPVGLRDALRQGALLDPERLREVLRHNIGMATFAEAFAHSGRVLNISVSPTHHRQKPRLLTHLTTPDVLVLSAAVASSALPGLFPPAQLEARGPDGVIGPHIPEERWVDGSLHGDLPKMRMARLHNVNHFIVSQTNPHVLPFVQHHGRRGLTPAVTGLVSATVRTQGALVADLAHRVQRQGRGPLSAISDRAYALFTQEYGGDIDLHPRFRLDLYRKVVSNPTPADLRQFVRGGERSVWPKMEQIRQQTRIGRTFRDCLAQMAAAPEP